jgi:hypothetical protein
VTDTFQIDIAAQPRLERGFAEAELLAAAAGWGSGD